MPIFEYICESCGKQSEFLIRQKDEIVKCSCGSVKMKRLFSSFAVTKSDTRKCTDGSCSLPSNHCATGNCGMH
ncbi:FmdB family zinc ribbon protein [bacterium]